MGRAEPQMATSAHAAGDVTQIEGYGSDQPSPTTILSTAERSDGRSLSGGVTERTGEPHAGLKREACLIGQEGLDRVAFRVLRH